MSPKPVEQKPENLNLIDKTPRTKKQFLEMYKQAQVEKIREEKRINNETLEQRKALLVPRRQQSTSPEPVLKTHNIEVNTSTEGDENDTMFHIN